MEIHRYLMDAREKRNIPPRGGVILRRVGFVMLLAGFLLLFLSHFPILNYGYTSYSWRKNHSVLFAKLDTGRSIAG